MLVSYTIRVTFLLPNRTPSPSKLKTCTWNEIAATQIPMTRRVIAIIVVKPLETCVEVGGGHSRGVTRTIDNIMAHHCKRFCYLIKFRNFIVYAVVLF